ncbi:N-acetyltransferase ESCO2 [Acyrthosiphon pisum]|uniref:N-acetyltransferase ESCO2 n=1 Tax=Acyrthosiphon pisum TaxID=7029 RepID=A0A8R2D1P8_ACYPI|nr:N-acetyltransferase ESCO2 [Acyrthosiphon pisum]|eukprot:XP_016656595.1 PREDICTED: N-acetyltransferase ESCO2 [Acyrthosiphon pisum]
MKSYKKKEKTNLTKKNKTPKQSSSKKNVWTEYMHQDKPKRILLEQDNNRKFFKSKVIHNDTPNKKKDNGFNFKVINWNDENSNSSRVELNESNLNSPKILIDNNIDENGQNINKLELLDDNHKENSNVEKYLAAYSSPAPRRLKEVSNSSIDVNDTVINEPDYTSIDFNDRIIDEFAAIDDSVLVTEVSSQTNMFPIFINETPPLSRTICSNSNEKKSTVRKGRKIIDDTQYQIYAGQKKFGGFLCKECNLYYSRGEPEDEAEHDKYHKAKDIFKYKSSKNEKVIFKDIDERIVVISGSDTKMLCSKALEVMLYVDKELGCYTECSVLPTTKKVHLYIKKRQVIGCLVIDLITQAYRNLETETEDMVVVSEESYPVKAGVNSIWTRWDCRNTGIAKKLLDYFRKNYTFGHILALDEIAFTVPTRSGKQFIKKYTNRNDFLVYTGW